jgi:hypothetical protein
VDGLRSDVVQLVGGQAAQCDVRGDPLRRGSRAGLRQLLSG